jgi:hypothetical protein
LSAPHFLRWLSDAPSLQFLLLQSTCKYALSYLCYFIVLALLFFLIIIIFYSHMHILFGSFLPPAPLSHPLPLLALLVLAFFLYQEELEGKDHIQCVFLSQHGSVAGVLSQCLMVHEPMLAALIWPVLDPCRGQCSPQVKGTSFDSTGFES